MEWTELSVKIVNNAVTKNKNPRKNKNPKKSKLQFKKFKSVVIIYLEKIVVKIV